jgi:hypothetical protein
LDAAEKALAQVKDVIKCVPWLIEERVWQFMPGEHPTTFFVRKATRRQFHLPRKKKQVKLTICVQTKKWIRCDEFRHGDDVCFCSDCLPHDLLYCLQ